MQEYRYELHAHTSEISLCAVHSAVELVDSYADLNYTGIVVTDHMHSLFADRYTSWEQCVQSYLQGYRAAKKQGEKRGIKVLLGMEISFVESPNDYLVYGLTEDLLSSMKFAHRMGLKAFYKKYAKDILLVQAHPYRNGGRAAPAEFLHGVEGINCHPEHMNRNKKAMAFWGKHPHLLCTCGSDAHEEWHVGRGTMIFGEKLENAVALKEALRAGAYQMEAEEYADLVRFYEENCAECAG